MNLRFRCHHRTAKIDKFILIYVHLLLNDEISNAIMPFRFRMGKFIEASASCGIGVSDASAQEEEERVAGS